MAFLRNDLNEYGTPVTWFTCEFCGDEFSICPAKPEHGHDNWKGCLSDQCDSYDPSRDADILFMTDEEIEKHKTIVSMQMLLRRKLGVCVAYVDGE